MADDFVLDNWEVAILTRVNTLAERYGIKPYEFHARVDHPENDPAFQNVDQLILDYETCPSDADRKTQFLKMLRSLGADVKESWVINGTAKDLIDALDNSIQLAPQMRARH